MSGRAVGHAYRYSPFSGTTQLVLLAIADTVNDTYGNRFFASQATLSTKARVARSSTQRAIEELIAGGWIKPVRGRAGTPGWEGDADWGGVNSYQFLFPADLPIHYDDGRDPDGYRPDGRAIPTRSEDMRHGEASPSEANLPDHEASNGPEVAPPSGHSEEPTSPTMRQGLPDHEATTCPTIGQGCPTMGRDNSIELNRELKENETTPVEHASVPDRRSGEDGVGTVSQLFDCGGLSGRVSARVAINHEGEALWFDTPADAVYGLWRILNGKRATAVFSEKRRKRVEDCLAVLGLNRCLDAVRGNTVSEFHQGDNDRGGRRFDDLTLIFGSVDAAERFERYWTDPASRVNGMSSRKAERRAPGQHHGPTGVLPDVDAYDEMARTWGKRR